MVAEGALTEWSDIDNTVASTGPRPRGRGRRHAGSVLDHVVESFNGAATTWSRKAWVYPRWGTNNDASTGPRPRGRGRGVLSDTGGWDVAGFNGAATTWSRKAGPGSTTTTAISLLQRGRDHVVAEGTVAARELVRRLASTGPRPRGRGRDFRAHHDARLFGASTGPRPRGRGRARPAPPPPPAPRFNGAATTWSRKGHRAYARYREIIGFNGAATTWSRKDDPVARQVAIISAASTGPRPRGRGRAEPEATAVGARTLQRGRDHVVAEGSWRPPTARQRGRLQRGRDHVVAEGPIVHVREPPQAALQRGRDHVVAEGQMCKHPSAIPGCFNGAATTWSRKVLRATTRDSGGPMLQRGRDHVVAEGR